MAQGETVYWDRWSLPRRLSERRETVDDTIPDEYLFGKIAGSSLTWGIETKHDKDVDNYAYREYQLAISLKKYCAF